MFKIPFFKFKTTEPFQKTKRKVNKPLREAVKLLNSNIVQNRVLGSERLLLLNNPDCVPFLTKRLEPSEDCEVLKNIIEALRNLRDIRATEKLIAFIKTYPRSAGSSSLVADAIHALGSSKDPRGPDFIYSILKEYQAHPATTVIYMVTIHQLGGLKCRKAFNDIFKFITDESANKYLREYAVEAVLKINKKKAVGPLLDVFEEENLDWPFRRQIISNIIYSENGKLVKELEKYKDDVDPYISESIRKYLSGERLFKFSETKRAYKKRGSKYLITTDWWRDIIEYRRWINDLFKTKLKVKENVFSQDESIVRELRNDCQDELDFNTLILCLASQIDSIDVNLLDQFISASPKKGDGSINKLELFLTEKVPNYNLKIICNLRIIHRARSKKRPIHITSELPGVLTQLGFYTFPPEWKEVWKKLKEIYIEALKLLKDDLERI